MRKSLSLSSHTQEKIEKVRSIKFKEVRVTSSHIICRGLKDSGIDNILEKLEENKNLKKTFQSSKYTLDIEANEILDACMRAGYSADAVINVGLDFLIGTEKTNLQKYFSKNLSGFYPDPQNGEYRLRSIDPSKDRDEVRLKKALEQADLMPVPLGKIFGYVNEFLELIRAENGFNEKNVRTDTISLEGQDHLVVNNGIIIKGCDCWIAPQWDKNAHTYTVYDPKYGVIKNTFQLERVSDLLWMKFTHKGHLAVVAKGCDINFDEDSSCGTLVRMIGDSFDKFVFVFPLTQEMISAKDFPNSLERRYSTAELELAVGNYLIDKGVPIIDYFSHMG